MGDSGALSFENIVISLLVILLAVLPGLTFAAPVGLKSCAGTVCKDRWERKVYAR